jgi:CubicO group peptidase (beta-lactamase class C family)
MKYITLLSLSLYIATHPARTQSIQSNMQQAIDAYVAQHKFVGTVLVARRDSILIKKGYGLRDVATGSPNTPQTIFQVASLAKQFTAAIILKLQEQGKLTVSDRVSKYFPGYPNGDKITIHQLLNHTSGIYNYTDNRVFNATDQSIPVTLDSMIGLFSHQPLNFEPGTKFAYSNSGYTMLGYIIEKITGNPYQQVLESMIIRPLRLSNTGYDFISLADSNKSTGYYSYTDEDQPVAKYVHPTILYTTGALFSTVEDLYTWHKALMGSRFLSAASKLQLYTPGAGPYGYGWFADSLFGKKRVSHDGNVSGFKANINRFPDDDVCVIALSNANSSSVGGLVRLLVTILYQQPYQLPAPKTATILSDEILASYTGLYAFDSSTAVTILLKDHKLYFQQPDLTSYELVADSPTFFTGKTMKFAVEFIRQNGTGVVTQLLFYRDKQPVPAKKIR